MLDPTSYFLSFLAISVPIRDPQTHAMSPLLRGCVAADKAYRNHCELPNGVQILHEGLYGECSLEEIGQGRDPDRWSSWASRHVIIGRASSVLRISRRGGSARLVLVSVGFGRSYPRATGT